MKNQSIIKKLLWTVPVLLITLSIRAQGFPYKALITDDQGVPLSNQSIAIFFDIYDVANTLVYSEAHAVSTDDNGIVSVNIGEGNVISGDFYSIDWSIPFYSVEVWVDPNGNGGINLGRFTLGYVPYAKFAETGGSVFELDDLNDAKVNGNGTSIFIGEDAGSSDDGSDNRNVAIGYAAMEANTSGEYNTAVGYKALKANTTGGSNVAVGNSSLVMNTTGSANTVVGAAAMNLNTTGRRNTALGYQALVGNSQGENNIAIGYQSAFSNTRGSSNIAIGSKALFFNTNLGNLVAIGDSALYHNGQGASLADDSKYNTAVGSKSLYSNTTGSWNSAHGYQSLYSNTTGNSNTAIGYRALYSNTTGNNNNAIGDLALFLNTTGDYNSADGHQSMYSNTTGDYNTAVGYKALYSNTTGQHNTAVGVLAFRLGNDYENSTGVGYFAYVDGSNQVRLGNSSVSSIGGYANWTNLSDGRFKTDVRENVPGLALVKKLRPVTYHLDMEALARFQKIPDSLRLKEAEAAKAAELQIGFVAQEVEQAARELGFDFHAVDKPQNPEGHYGLRYAEFVPVLVKAVQEQQEMIDELKRQNQTQAQTIRRLLDELSVLKEELTHLKKQ